MISKKILMTGSEGFIGSFLKIKLLESKYKIQILVQVVQVTFLGD